MADEQVLVFGNPRAGTPLMVARPLVGLDLPLRVLVWRASDGRVWASYQAAPLSSGVMASRTLSRKTSRAWPPWSTQRCADTALLRRRLELCKGAPEGE